jgi:diaminohydroxyphosphoribosylaminopyrimidine deaminase/5-amino-6-(5-phosphoribosylamino)uracil reductase
VKNHQKFMKKCLELAMLGLEKVKTNPLVGCVIVLNNKIISEGYHKKFGEAHAEVNAINKIKDKEILKEATLYVNLEPCSHYGKTPPCTELIIKYKIKEVVIANVDPFSMVNGRGINLLKKHTIVTTGILKDEAFQINKKYFTTKSKKNPYIILKWAESKDGYINNLMPGITQISDKASIHLAHKWRNEVDAIMVGSNTIICDNPHLTTRHVLNGKNPVRVTIDTSNKILDTNSNILNNDAQTIIFNSTINKQIKNISYIKITQKHNKSHSMLKYILSILFKRQIHSIIIEGGTILINQFIKEGLWDEARVFSSEKLLRDGIKAPVLKKLQNIKNLKNKFKYSGKDKLYILSR